MSPRDRFLGLADRLRSKASPTQLSGVAGFDVRTARVIVRSRVWTGGHPQTGAPVVTNLEILPRPHVQGASGGLLVGPVTPSYVGPPAGGYTPDQLNPGDAVSFEWVYVVIEADGVERPYKLMHIDTTRPFRYMLTLTALDRKVPF